MNRAMAFGGRHGVRISTGLPLQHGPHRQSESLRDRLELALAVRRTTPKNGVTPEPLCSRDAESTEPLRCGMRNPGEAGGEGAYSSSALTC
jgi:hypothetical protein